MNKISIIIPSRNEQFLQKTINDLINKAAGEIEIIAILDGYWPNPSLQNHKKLRIIHFSKSRGMRAGINTGVSIATGEYIMKCDAHCMFDKKYDEILKADCKDNWVIVPRRKRLDPENWCILDVGKPDIDYMYLSYPDDPNDWGGSGLNGKNWDVKNKDTRLKEILIDDLMSAQGSCWFMPTSYFYDLELMDEKNYGSFWNEFQEIGLKCWLSGGEVKVNKKTWYAHLHKGKKYGRGYYLPEESLIQGREYSMNWFYGQGWHKQTKSLSWLINKFAPVPGWPEGWIGG